MNHREIKTWLEQHEIEDYIIHPDLTVTIEEDLFLENKPISALPFQLREVKGTLSIANCEFTTLKEVGLPAKVQRFIATDNNIYSFEGCPEATEIDISHNFISDFSFLPLSCDQLNVGNNQIRSLLSFNPEHKISTLSMGNNKLEHPFNQLENLIGLPDNVQRLNVASCGLTSSQGLSSQIDSLNINNNQLREFSNFPNSMSFLNISHNELTSLKGCPILLDDLMIRGNFITHFDEDVSVIDSLDCSQNKLESLVGLPNCSMIIMIQCGLENHHFQEYNFQNNTSLNYLSLLDNHLTEFYAPCALGHLRLMGNPLNTLQANGAIKRLDLSIDTPEELMICQHVQFDNLRAYSQNYGNQPSHCDYIEYSYEEVMNIISKIEFNDYLQKQIIEHKPIKNKKKI